MLRTSKLSFVASALLACGVFAGTWLASGEAHAKKPGVLEGKPIVTDKIELRKLRGSVTPLIGMSLSQPYVHKGMVGGKARFDITDWIGVRGMFQYGVINIDSQLLEDMNEGLPRAGVTGEPGVSGTGGCIAGLPCRPDDQLNNPAPLRQDFQAGLTRLQWQSSVDVSFTPFSGKLGMFSAIFTEYDLYVFGGLGITGWDRHYPDVDSVVDEYVDAGALPSGLNPGDEGYCVTTGPMANGANSECLLHPVTADTGVRLGGSFGAGLHLFITDWVSINLEVQDIVVRQNIVGHNATITDVPPRVNNGRSRNNNPSDRTVVHNSTFNLGATFYFPPKPKRSQIKP